MADKRISQLVDRGTIANNDVVPIVVSGASTTNKATISSIQTFMQGNLDFGVTSVGITLGSSGTDVSVTGSPITTSGNITINIPSASATARGLVTTGTQTFAGAKTFSSDILVNSLTIGKGGSGINTNTALGANALILNTTGTQNTGVGFQALVSNTTGAANTSVGNNSGIQNTTGDSNTIVGASAGQNNNTGSNNSFFGALSGGDNTTGSSNVAVGLSALSRNITGGQNTAIGRDAGRWIADGVTNNTNTNSSIYIGFFSKANADNQTNQIVIGHNATGQGSNTVTIGNSSTTSNKFFGRVIHADAVNADESATLGQVNTAIGGYVTLATAQTITAQKTFTTSGSSDTMIISHGSGSGFALDVIKAGSGEAIRVTKTSGSGNAMSVSGGNSNFAGGITTTSAVLTSVLQGVNANFTSLIETAGDLRVGTTASIKHNSTVYTLSGFNNIQGNINSFVVTNESKNLRLNFPSVGGLTHTLPDTSGTLALTTDLGAYLPLTGGTLTGALNGTSGSFNGNVTSLGFRSSSLDGFVLRNNANTLNLGGITRRSFWVGGSSEDTQIFAETGYGIFLNTGGSTSSGLSLASTGAATFSSSVRANASSTIYGATQDSIQTILTLGGQNASAQAKELYFRLSAGGTPAWTLQTASVGTDSGVNILPNGTNGLSIAYTGAATFSGNAFISKASPLLVLNDTSGSGAQIGSFGGNLNLIDNATGTKGMVMSLSTGAATFSSSVSAANNVLINLGTPSTPSTGGTLWLTTNNNTTRAAAIQAVTPLDDNAHHLLFYTNPTFSTPVERMRITSDAYLRMASGSGGIQFNGDTAAANALDDYEEGAWIPNISFGGASVGITYAVTNGQYTKIGRQVSLSCYILLTNKGSSTGVARIIGLPFTIGATSTFYVSASFSALQSITYNGSIQGYGEVNSNAILLNDYSESGVQGSITNTNFANNSQILVSMTYFV